MSLIPYNLLTDWLQYGIFTLCGLSVNFRYQAFSSAEKLDYLTLLLNGAFDYSPKRAIRTLPLFIDTNGLFYLCSVFYNANVVPMLICESL